MPPEEDGLSWAPETGFQPEGRLVVRAPAALLAYLEPLWPRKSLNFHPFLEHSGSVLSASCSSAPRGHWLSLEPGQPPAHPPAPHPLGCCLFS